MRSFAAAFAIIIATSALMAQQQRTDAVGVGPEPSPTPIAWEFDFKYMEPRRIEVRNPDTGRQDTYWYLLYTVTNKSRATQQFYPIFELVTDELRLISTDLGISPLVFDAIKERHKITHKYLVHPTKALGELRSGDDYARESVAIWRADDLGVSSFQIYVSGLSGEARVLRNPSYNPQEPETRTVFGPDGREREETVNPKYFTLQKTLRLSYTLPASTKSREEIEPRLDDARWIMR